MEFAVLRRRSYRIGSFVFSAHKGHKSMSIFFCQIEIVRLLKASASALRQLQTSRKMGLAHYDKVGAHSGKRFQ